MSLIITPGYTAENAANKGIASGYAGLDATSKVAAVNLPSYVDDVLEYANLAALPVTGASGIIYIAADTSKTYRWSGSAYAEIVASPGTTDAITEGTTNKFYTDARARAAISATQNVTYNSSTGVITGPVLSGYLTAETDTLATVTARGATTALKVSIGSGIAQGAPSATDVTANATLLLSGNGGNYLAFGQHTTGQAQWIQSSYSNPTTAVYPIALQPLGGNVGIGTYAPAQKFHVVSASNYQGILVSGSAAPTIGFVQNAGTVQTWKAGISGLDGTAFSIGQGTGGTDSLIITTGNNVGIGITSPTARIHFGGQTGGTATPLALQFSQDFSSGATALSSKIFLYNDGGGQVYGFAIGSNSDIQYHSGGIGNSIGKHVWYGGNSEKMRLDSNNLGIGTTNPLEKLQVTNGNISIYNALSTTNYLKFVSGFANNTTSYIAGSNNANWGGHLLSWVGRPGGGSGAQYGTVQSVYDDPTVGYPNQNTHLSVNVLSTTANSLAILYVGTGSIATNTRTGLYVETGAVLAATTGNVGIGTATPRNQLEVGNISANQTVRIGGVYSGPTTGYTGVGQETLRHQIVFSGWRDSQTNTIGSKIVSISYTNYNAAGWHLVQKTDLAFFTQIATPTSTDNTTERLRITADGYVGIGVIAPASSLHIIGSAAGQTTGAITDAGSMSGIITVADSNNQLSGGGGGIVFGSGATRFAAIKGYTTGGAGSTVGDLIFSTRNATTDTALSERMRITAGGSVGIGTAAASVGKLAVQYVSNGTGPLDPAKAGLNLWGDSSVRLLFGTYTASPNAAYIQTSNTGSGFPLALNPSGGNVGIGTATPNALLNVYSATAGSAKININDQSSSTTAEPMLQFGLANSNGFSTTDAARIWVNATSSNKASLNFASYNAGTPSTAQMVLVDGNVGVGTLTPVTLKSATTLQVYGNAKLGNSNISGLLGFGDTGSTGCNVGIWRSAGGAYGTSGNYLSLGGYEGITFTTGNADIASQTERMRILANGNVGIGTATPAAKLDLGGNTASSVQQIFGRGVDDPDFTVRYTNGVAGTSAFIGTLGLDYGGGTWADMAAIKFFRRSTAGELAFFASAATAAGTEQMRITSTGVGIGTVSPLSKLDITQTTNTDGDVPALRVYASNRTQYTGISFNSLASTYWLRLQSGTSQYLTLETNGSEKLRVTSAGEVLIGLSTAQPNGKLQVAGSIGLSGNTQIRQATNGDGNSLQVWATQVLAGTSNSTTYSYTDGSLLASVAYGDGTLLLDVGRGTNTEARFKIANSTNGNALLSFGKSTLTTLYADTSTGNVGINTTTPGYKLEVVGSFAATTKSFVIDHPTKPGMKLRYGSLEGPENGIYIRGKLTGTNTIELPEYWTKLVDPDSITVNLTAIGKSQDLYVEDIRDNVVYIGGENVNCFYTVFAERVDVEKLEVEIA